MKKLILITIGIILTGLISCTNSQGDSFGYTTPHPIDHDMYSEEAGNLQEPGGVVTAIESENGDSDDNSDLTIRE